ncbi:GntG family PLP-dependent aldolase [Kamptonema cortianum]|nr:GntG family PLP-dependent aldolase [Geitlerinema splendidum]MDK3155224.1 GntG family PLP-dependent aldolase [Kamptonema cortianum]
MKTIDLRSDTVTQPTSEMREAMMAAPLGDDVLGDDPTVAELERIACLHTGHEAAVFVPSGTMGNQIAIAAHTRPGDIALVEDEAHILHYEVGAIAVINGVTVRNIVSENGVVDPTEVRRKHLKFSLHTPESVLLCLENSHNRAGGTVTSVERHRELRNTANELGMKIHLDGARVFNAAAALGVQVRDITNQVDSVSFCLSKGLGAPVGSVLTGDAEFIERARIWRKRLGGGMRQSGLLAAAGIWALEHMMPKLSEDHRRAKEFASQLSDLRGVRAVSPETNIVMLDFEWDADTIQARLEDYGVLAYSFGPNRMRFVFHHQISDAATQKAVQAIRSLVSTLNVN